MNLKHHVRWVLPLALIVLTAFVYWPGLSGDFLFDDYPNIVTNERIHAESLDWASLKTAAHGYQPGAYGRPLATISFAIDYVIGGKDAWGYKLTSLLVHLINSLLIFWLLGRLFALPKANASGWEPLGQFTIALLWAVHPLQVSSVLYVVQRMETLAVTFVLLALIAYIRGRVAQRDGHRGWPWLAGSAVLGGIGMLSKETAILFPVYALAMELTVLGFEARAIRTHRFLQWSYVGGIVVAGLVFLTYVLPRYTAPNVFSGRDFSLYESLLTQLRVLPMYLGQMLLPLPANLTFYYDDFTKSTGWLSPATTLVGGAFLLALLAVAWGLRKRLPLASLGILWFFSAHLLTSNVFNLELVFEHRNYFALLGVLLVLADMVRRIPMRDGPGLKQVAIGAVVLGFGLLCLLRSATWGDPVHLAVDLVARNPASPRASSDLATLYVGMSDSNSDSPFYLMGAREFERGSLLPGASPLPEQGLILMSAMTNQAVKDEWWDRLIQKVQHRPIGPQEVLAVTGLMKQRYRGIELDDQRLSEAYKTLLTRTPSAPMFATYGDFAFNYLSDPTLARAMFIEAVDHSRDDPAYAERIAGSLLEDGHPKLAAEVLERSKQVRSPDFNEN